MALPNLRNIVSPPRCTRALSPFAHSALAHQQFASFRSPLEEREYSRRAFYTFLEFIGVTCLMHYVAVKAWSTPARIAS